MPTVVTISGTNRPDNYTAHALAVVNDEFTNMGITPTEFDARRMTLAFPGQPATEDGETLKAAVEGADGIVLATPEYHGGFSAMTKLIIENMGFPSVMSKKPVALVGVAAGRIGAIKSLEQLRAVCAHTGAIVLPGSVSVAGVRGAFDAEGNCTDEATDRALRGVAGGLMEFIQDYVCPKYALEEMVRGGETPWTATV
jgi:NAD(P)H-dependent FMN reductase